MSACLKNSHTNDSDSSAPTDPAIPVTAVAGEYFRLRATRLERSREDEFSDLCFEIGASGVAEDLAFIQKDLRYDPDVLETPHLDVDVFFEQAPGEDAILRLQSRFPETRIEVKTEANRDWLTEWKKGFKPFLFAAPYWVVPSWCEVPAEAPRDPSKIIFVEPGMAFGTGTHETTRLAARLLIDETARKVPQSLVDVGTGTGILALIARRAGSTRVVGTDIDPEARRTARENLERNNIGGVHHGIVIADESVESLGEKFEVVVANIIDGVLLQIRQDLVGALLPGGRMVLSGILVDREEEFYRTFTSDTGLKVLKRLKDGEWSAALLEKV